MNIEKKTIRSDIPGHHTFGSIGYAGSTSEEARRLVVGRDIGLTGQIAACDHLVVEGVVQAETFAARRMDILEAGLFVGAADVQDAVIAGRFEGRLTVPGRLTVKSTGRIFGQVEYGVLEIEAGAKIEGHVAMMMAAEQTAPLETPAIAGNVEQVFEHAAGDETKVFRRVVGY